MHDENSAEGAVGPGATPAAARVEPPKRYSLGTAVCLIMGICIGSGIFFKSDNVLMATGGDVGLGVAMFCVAALYIVFGGLALSLFAARTDGAGGLVDYAQRFVSPGFARVLGWFYTFVYLPSVTAVIFWVVGVYACLVAGVDAGFWTQLGIGVVALLACGALNALAPRASGWLQGLTTALKAVPLVAVGAIGLAALLGGTAQVAPAAAAQGAAAQGGSLAWLAAAAPIAFAFDGWTAAPSIAPELADARRNLPRALVIAPLAILGLYLAYFVGLSWTLGPDAIVASGDASLSALFVRLLGPQAATLPNLVALLAIVGTGNGLVLALMRMPQAVAQRGDVPGAAWLAEEGDGHAVPPHSALVAMATILCWMGAHAAVQTLGLIPNGDVSEVSVSLSMLVMVPLFAAALRMWRRGEAGVVRGLVAPVLATLGCVFVGVSGVASAERLPFVLGELALVALLWLLWRFVCRDAEPAADGGRAR